MTRAPEHLLRTLAAVPPATRVLDVGCGGGTRVVPLAQLGFEVNATDRDAAQLDAVAALLETAGARATLSQADPAHLPFEDDTFDWVVASGILDAYSHAEQLDLLAEWRRVLRPGGWLYLTVAPSTSAQALSTLLDQAALVESEAPRIDPAERVLRGIFRRVEADTIR